MKGKTEVKLETNVEAAGMNNQDIESLLPHKSFRVISPQNDFISITYF